MENLCQEATASTGLETLGEGARRGRRGKQNRRLQGRVSTVVIWHVSCPHCYDGLMTLKRNVNAARSTEEFRRNC
jgi:hypothetical protein